MWRTSAAFSTKRKTPALEESCAESFRFRVRVTAALRIAITHVWGACACWLMSGMPPPLSPCFFGMQRWWSCQGRLAPRHLPAYAALPGKPNRQFGEMGQKIWFILCMHAFLHQWKKRLEIDAGKWGEEASGDRQDLYSPRRGLILHFVGALFNQWQIFVVVNGLLPTSWGSQILATLCGSQFSASKNEIDSYSFLIIFQHRKTLTGRSAVHF